MRVEMCAEARWAATALTYGSQLLAYRDRLDAAGLETVIDLWIHFPVLGQMLRIAIEEERIRS